MDVSNGNRQVSSQWFGYGNGVPEVKGMAVWSEKERQSMGGSGSQVGRESSLATWSIHPWFCESPCDKPSLGYTVLGEGWSCSVVFHTAWKALEFVIPSKPLLPKGRKHFLKWVGKSGFQEIEDWNCLWWRLHHLTGGPTCINTVFVTVWCEIVQTRPLLTYTNWVTSSSSLCLDLYHVCLCPHLCLYSYE